MSTTTQMALIDRVAIAMWTHRGFAQLHPEGFHARPESIQNNYRAEAEVAIAAVLPDRAAFVQAVTMLMVAVFEHGNLPTMEERRAGLMPSLESLTTLVYGDES